jgi:hypothetical protein
MQEKLKKILAFLLCFLLCFQQAGFAEMAVQLNLGGYLSGLRSAFSADKFRPLHLRYLSYDNLNNSFRLLLDKGDTKNPQAQELESTSKTLLNYFFIGLSLPNDSFWVNLRPDSEDNVIDPWLAQTDIGRIMLETDLQLKKDTAKATSPETPEGRKYWDLLYNKAEELFGYENVTIPTLTRPWIVPGEIIIRETTNSAYIYKATLKVMLEQDYLKNSSTYSFKDPRLKALNEYSSQLIRELIIPKLTKEVNSSKRYASLRQVYYSLIMAQWFKARFRNKPWAYSRVIDHKNLSNLTSKNPWTKTTYFQEYQKSFKDGEYNIQEPRSTPFGQTIRSYFSGGMELTQLGGAVFGAEEESAVASARNPHLLALEVRVKEALGLDSEVVIPDEKFLAVQQAHEVGQGRYLGTQKADGTYEKHQDQNFAYTLEEIAQKARILAGAGFTKEERRRLMEHGVVGNAGPRNWAKELSEALIARDIGGLKSIVLEADREEVVNLAVGTLENMLKGGQLSAAEAITEITGKKPELITPNTVLVLGAIPLKYSHEYNVIISAIFEIAIKRPDLSQQCIWALASHEGASNEIYRDKFYDAIATIGRTRGIPILESLLNERPVRLERNYDLILKAIEQIAQEPSQDIPPSFVNSLLNIFNTSGAPHSFYRPFGDTIATIGLIRKYMVDSSTISALEKFLYGEHYRAILYSLGAIATVRPDLAEQCLSIFERYITNEAFSGIEKSDESIYGIISDAVYRIRQRNPDFRPLNPLFLLPKRILQHGLPQHQIYFNPYFKENTQDLSEEERYSISLSAYRLLKRYNLEFSDINIVEAVRLIMKKRNEVSFQSVFSNDRRVINIAHSEERFGLNEMASLAQQAGVAASNISSHKGRENKQSALEDIGESKGPLTIFFLGHGGKNHLWLDSGQIGSEDSDELRNPLAISYQELGDRLIQRGKPHEVTILINACYSYNFGVNLLSYLAERGITDLPVVVACSNFDKIGYGNLLLEGLQSSLGEERRTLTMRDVFRAEEHAFEYQDSAIFVPIEPNTTQEHFTQILTSQPQLEGGIDSSRDALPHASLELTGPASSSHNAQLPPAMLEVGFMGANGLVSTNDLDVLGGPADEIIDALKKGALALPIIVSGREMAITPGVISINGREINIVINNEQEGYVSRSPDGKTISINVVRINLLLKDPYLADEERKAVTERFLIHEIVEAYALQLGRNEADAHHAGMMAEAMHPANSQRIRNAIFTILSDRDKLQARQVISPSEKMNEVIAIPISHTPNPDIDKKGGIDFRSLPIVTQAIGNLHVNLSGATLQRLSNVNVDEELSQLQRMLSSGITPSTERIKEYIQASCAKGGFDKNKIILCISDILRMEEESYASTEPMLRGILVVLESARSNQELKEVFLGNAS